MKTETVQMKVSGLMCSFCTMSVEKALKRYPAIKSVMVNLVHGIVLVEADTAQMSREELANAVEKLGYSVSSTEVQQYKTDEDLFQLIKRRGTIGIIISVIDLLIDPLNIFSIPANYRTWFSFIIAVFVLLWVGYPIFRKTLMAIRQRVINANVLLSAGAWGSFIIGTLSLINPHWPNFLPVAAWLMSLHLFFGYFKLDTRKKASEAVRKLLSLQPSKARVLRGGQIIEALTKEVVVGEVVEVRPGERIPLDGKVLDGMASVDESSFTGESVPVTKEIESYVIGGTLNLDGALQIQVSKIGGDSFLSQIVRLMSQISEKKPPIELLADRLMNYYGPVVFIVAAISFVGWSLLTGDYTKATIVLITTIIMGYPCALGITTPMLAAIAGGKGISIGLLVKASEVFYGLSKIDTIVFDKTGTLTYGRPTVTDVEAFRIDIIDVLSLAATIETKSEHPLGQAIAFYALREGATKLNLKNFRAVPGKGVTATVEGNEVMIGNPSFVKNKGIIFSDSVNSRIDALGVEGKTVIVLSQENEVIGLIALQDTPRKDAAQVVKKLSQRNIHTVMLTGDSTPVAEAIGRCLGISQVQAELLPANKVAAIEALQNKGKKVAMVGDGINDAPALVQSDVGIAIGAGTDIAIESAGVILIGDKLIDVLNALILGKASYRILTGNVLVAVIFNIVGMTLAALGFITPLLAVAMMILSIFTILINTLRVRAINLEATDDNGLTVISSIEYKIPNMVCEGCAESITTSLKQLPGIQKIKPKVMQKQVLIEFKPDQVKQEQVKEAINKAGFTAIEL
ncbi:heavy metal translocating P-type ATPase [Mucilaginibacter rubeus]|uniref:Heavy metal translocating P-type ATPase n=1 Tax=Mucilaginibacter rubeus TaxID=2027860 RepID=A0AAE6JG39_9SPHI|nr:MULTISPECIES: heavy metal translocating P-type ATPase [Mucilaginibacter]QEM04916.1 heavy metal translocating P-type ATPase [Mucilaginibacter rubeus]QEM17510.1 heavy metal translocating P-type ATPase [Mucilaginibacter gossypii]QTE45969.1 heavy metal translocating P-type ATPase [Mucilaginibacter rubeus]QTE52566.1 heavy metal translocating P-type ATPase [Mucilaginibacter rubeus]QTE57655.1 heavy metal translocating P-type ATPase [Mucilaginibacter rubeus]